MKRVVSQQPPSSRTNVASDHDTCDGSCSNGLNDAIRVTYMTTVLMCYVSLSKCINLSLKKYCLDTWETDIN